MPREQGRRGGRTRAAIQNAKTANALEASVETDVMTTLARGGVVVARHERVVNGAR